MDKGLKFWLTFIGLKLFEISAVVGFYMLGRWEAIILGELRGSPCTVNDGCLIIFPFVLAALSAFVLFVVGGLIYIWIIKNLDWTEEILKK